MENVQLDRKYLYFNFHEFLINNHDATVIIHNSTNFRSLNFFTPDQQLQSVIFALWL
jgi:hypothetical protein